MPTPTKPYTIAVTFTSLSGLTTGDTVGKIAFVNRTTRDSEYVSAKAKSTTTAVAIVELNNTSTSTFPNGYSNGDVIDVVLSGVYHGSGSHTIDTTNKGGGKLSIAAIATSSTTHPSLTL